MKHTLFLFSFLLGSLCNCIAQDSKEHFWKGIYIFQDLDPQTMELTINESTRKASLFIVEYAYETPLRMHKFSTDSIYFTVPSLNATFKGKRENGILTGFWLQGGIQVPVTFNPSKKKIILRPQTPQPPYPYGEEKIIYYNQDQSIQYGATLTYPKDKASYPTVILITGSGQQDRDETLFNHKPFWVIADYFSRNGIAVLRVDDRGVGQTTGKVSATTSQDYSKDVLAGIEYLKSRNEIDKTQIGLVGHSEGSTIALLTAQQNSDIAFIISLAGVGVTGIELGISQYKYKMKQAYPALTPENLEQLIKLQRSIYTIAAKPTDEFTAKKEIIDAKTQWQKSQDSLTSVLAGFRYVEKSYWVQDITNLKSLLLPWMRYTLAYRPLTVIQQVNCPILFLNGEKDRQVFCDLNMKGFRQTTEQLQKKNVAFKQFPDLNHLFQHCQTGNIGEYREIEETFAPEVLNYMVEWIKNLEKNKK